VVLEEVDFDFATSTVHNKRSVVFDSGRHLEHEISVRLYGLHELLKVLTDQAFAIVEVSGHSSMRGHVFGSQSRSLIVVAERR
jgi:hypothetical protein